MIRSFIALDLPQSFYEEIKKAQNILQESSVDAKWVKPSNIHLTLKFLGNIHEDILPELKSAIAAAVSRMKPFMLHIDGVGVFPNQKRVRVVWLGLNGDLDQLKGLQESVETAAADLGFKPENRVFKPHLTLARLKSPQGVRDLLRQMEKINPAAAAFKVKEVVIFKSDLKPTGAVYTALGRASLAQ